MKRTLSILLAAVMLICVLPLAASAKTIKTITITDLDEPIIGENPDFDVTLKEAEEYGISFHVIWRDQGSGKVLTEKDEFEEDKYYCFQIWMSSEDNRFDYQSISDYMPEYKEYAGVVRINGKRIIVVSSIDTNDQNYKRDKCFVTTFVGPDGNKEDLEKNGDLIWWYGKAKAGTHYTVTFEMNGYGDRIEAESVLSGKTITRPRNQFVRGMEFGGWYSDPELMTEYIFSTPVTEDITLYAKWNKAEPVTDQEQTDTEYVCPFVDVTENEWYFPWVCGAHKMGLINGKDDTHYKPDDNMTYAEAIKLAACMNQLSSGGEITLTNGEEHWYDTYVAHCLDNGIISEDYSAVINESIDRQTYALIFSKAIPADALEEKNNIPDGSIPDVQNGNPNYDAIYTLYRAGIINGSDSCGTFNPTNFIRRSEVAAILNRMMDATVRVDAPAELQK